MAYPTLSGVLINLGGQLGYFWKFTTGGAFLVGLFFALKSIYQFKEYGEMRVMMSANTDIRKPMFYLLIGLVLIYAPFVAKQFLQTMFNVSSPVPYAYNASGNVGQQFKETVNFLGGIVEFIGFIAFIRGWIVIVHSVQQQSQPGSLAKGLMHILGGILAINIFGTFQLLQQTIGWTTGS